MSGHVNLASTYADSMAEPETDCPTESSGNLARFDEAGEEARKWIVKAEEALQRVASVGDTEAIGRFTEFVQNITSVVLKEVRTSAKQCVQYANSLATEDKRSPPLRKKGGVILNKSTDLPKKGSKKAKNSAKKHNNSPKKSSDSPKKSSDSAKKGSNSPKKSSDSAKKGSNSPKKSTPRKQKETQMDETTEEFCFKESLGLQEQMTILSESAKNSLVTFSNANAPLGASEDNIEIKVEPMEDVVIELDEGGGVNIAQAGKKKKSALKGWIQERGSKIKGDFSCVICKSGYMSEQNLRNHMKKTHVVTDLAIPCRKCSTKYPTTKKFFYHMRSKHPDERKSGECIACGKHVGDVNQHVYGVHAKGFKCHKCSRKMVRKSDLIGHLKTHIRSHIFSCNECGKMFSSPKYLKCHKIAKHRGEKFRCEVCGKEYSIPSALQRHLFNHYGVSEFQCKYCGKYFFSEGKLTEHMEKIHPSEQASA